MNKTEFDRISANMTSHGSPMAPDEKEKVNNNIDTYLISDIREDASLADIKSKQAEIISKQRLTYKEMQIRKRELCYLERVLIPAELHYKEQVTNSNRGVTPKDRMNKDEVEWRVLKLVSADSARGTLNIYDKIKQLKNSVDLFEGVAKNNKMISDRIENMLNAQINIDKVLTKSELKGV